MFKSMIPLEQFYRLSSFKLLETWSEDKANTLKVQTVFKIEVRSDGFGGWAGLQVTISGLDRPNELQSHLHPIQPKLAAVIICFFF